MTLEPPRSAAGERESVSLSAIPQGEPAYAHSKDGRPRSEWETVDAHLRRVSELAGEYADAFGARPWGQVLGAWHDLGKYSDEFQKYIIRSADPDAGEEGTRSGRVDHSTFGAQYASRTVGRHAGQLLAFGIAGHHAGLPDYAASDEAVAASSLAARLSMGPPRVPAVRLPPLAQAPRLVLPFRATKERFGFELAFFGRMLFSCLVDADRTATEEFCNEQKALARGSQRPGISQLRARLAAFMEIKSRARPTPINQARREILGSCWEAAEKAPGFFSLSVPTGAGKTLASLAFALGHAEKHGLRRVIVAIPFTSIVEQSASAYREALGDMSDALVEHHSSAAPTTNTRRNQLAAENWDAPIVVTTNVQLCDSLFAARTTPCRKIHRIARSVIVLDEAQTIPVDLLQPTLSALQELVSHYGCTVVLCTATQPAIELRHDFPIGISDVRPIATLAESLRAAFVRVSTVRIPGVLSDADLATRLESERAALCIVNTRKHARDVFMLLADRLDSGLRFHLSASMCAAHRSDVLARIRGLLAAEAQCVVVSTQLVEAGVDLDFPVVFRAPAGFDSLAQAAGRCNREGRLASGTLYLFETQATQPPGFLRQAADVARELSAIHADPLEPAAVEAYFRQLYWMQSHRWDRREVMSRFQAAPSQEALMFAFREGARRYQMIPDAQLQVLVPYNDDARRARDRFTAGTYDRSTFRDAQRYLVGVFGNTLARMRAGGAVIEHESGLNLLLKESAYDPICGLDIQADGLDAESLMI